MDDVGMARRIVIAVLWSYATWVVFSVVALVAPAPSWMGPMLAVMVGVVLAWGRDRVGVRHLRQNVSSARR
jgi:hypothetical protein